MTGFPLLRLLRQAQDKCAPYFALNGGASDFAKATADKSQGKQDGLRGNDEGIANEEFIIMAAGGEILTAGAKIGKKTRKFSRCN